MMENSDLSPDIMRAIEAGRKIEAIKLLRAELGIGLKEAKTIIDHEVAAYRKANPEPEGQANSGSLSMVVVFVVLAGILYFVFGKLF
jgi:ribosomal protein L7/L12